jgi:hypothetical protein
MLWLERRRQELHTKFWWEAFWKTLTWKSKKKMGLYNLMEKCCEDGMWMEVAQDCVQQWA